MKAPSILVLLVVSVIPSFAQERSLPEMPKPNRHIFVVGVSLLAVSKSADALSTRSLLDRGGWENTPVLGRSPSPQRQAGLNALVFVGQSGLFYATEHNRRSWVRWAGRAYIALEIVNHIKLATCNAGIDVHSTIVHNCRPFIPF